MTNVVNISLPDSEAMADRVVEEAARQLLTELVGDPTGGSYPEKSRIAKQIEQAVVEVIHRQAEELTPAIAQQVLDSGVQLTDAYGYASGSKRPLGAVIAERVEQQLNGAKYGSSSRGLIAEIINKEVEQQLRTGLKATLDDAKRKIIDAVSNEGTTALRQAYEKLMPELKTR